MLAISLTAPVVLPATDRVPWSSSRVQGSPEPALPYVSTRILHDQTIVEATDLVFIPNSDWYLIASKSGQVLAGRKDLPDPLAIALDLSTGNRRGRIIYSVEFPPEFGNNRMVYISATAPPGKMKVSRFRLSSAFPPVLDPGSEEFLIGWNSNGHNGCDLNFGPDGFLYISSGDGDSPAPPDPRETGQGVDDFSSCILRIDVNKAENGKPYAIPPDNPFIAMPGAMPEIWAYGFRNPWKTSFDPRDGALWVGDVGWEAWEMVFRIDHGGFNGGWSIVEGPLSIHPDWERGPTPIESPIVSHPHTEATSMTGGFIYRGSNFPELRNAYVYGDWGTGIMWALWWEDGKIVRHQEIANTPHRIVGFAEDNDYELAYLDYSGGGVYQLTPNPDTDRSKEFPRQLSETGLFTSTERYELAPGVHPFSITAPMWSDSAHADRAIAIPGMGQARQKAGYLAPPENSVLMRTLTIDSQSDQINSPRRIETQLLHFEGRAWRGYSYRWNEEQTDAELVEKNGEDLILKIKDESAPNGFRNHRWRFHSRSECVRCHQVKWDQVHGGLKAFDPAQLASRINTDGVSELTRLINMGLIEAGSPQHNAILLVNPYDKSKPIHARARSWLHANCAHCHLPGGSGAVMMYWPIGFDDRRTKAIGVPPTRGDFGIQNPGIISPGNPYHSTLLYRILTSGAGRMPIIGSSSLDVEGTLLLRDWIGSMDKGYVETKAPFHAEELDTTSSAMSAVFDALNPSSPDRDAIIAAGLNSDNPTTRDLFEIFLPPEKQRKSLGAGFDPMAVLSLTGNAADGKGLFFSATGSQCYTCHQIKNDGNDFGPNLSMIGSKYSKRELLRHCSQPSSNIASEWIVSVVETKDDELYSGFITERNPGNLKIKIAADSVVKIATDNITVESIQSLSLMPEGLLENMTAQDAADLIEFLSVLR